MRSATLSPKVQSRTKMNNFINSINHWLPLIDAVAKIATIVGVTGLLLAFFQYRHAVRIAKRNDRRAAVELAAKECTNLGSVLMPGFSRLRKDIEKSECEF